MDDYSLTYEEVIHILTLARLVDKKPAGQCYNSEHLARIRDLLSKLGIESCEVCGRTIGLQLHHKHYNTFGYETLNDISLLCRKCHALVHIAGKP